MARATALRRETEMLLAALFAAPLLVLVVQAFANEWRAPAIIPTEFGTRGFEAAFGQGNAAQALINSTSIALLTTGLALIIGWPAARALGHKRARQPAVIILVALPLLIPPFATGTGLAEWFIRLGIADTIVGYATAAAGQRLVIQRASSSLLVFCVAAAAQQALVLGSGGSSKAVKFVLEALGIKYQIVSRQRGEGALSYDQLDQEIMKSHTLIVNTTPLGMFPKVDAAPDLPYKFITPRHLLFDLVYNPEKTLFLSQGQEQGASIVNGSDMLIYQAEGSWEIWNKKR